MSTIAFIGLGNMGGHMAHNLVKNGHTVQGFDVVAEAKQRATENGVDVRESAAEAAKGADIVITMLPNGGLVNQVVQEILDTDSGEKLFIDSSTIAVEEARDIAELLRSRGHRFIDAPVSGGMVGAEAGTLAFMVGAAEEDFASAQPLFEAMGKTATHCGEVGAGQAAKVCNNMILGVQQIAVSEALVLGEKLGLSHQAFFDVVSNSTGACWALTSNCPVPGPVPTSPANNDFRPGFASALMSKDLNLAAQALQATGTKAEFGQAACDFYQKTVDDGFGDKDCSFVIERIREASN
ncbi:3-hydroxyisobutyrate dehydrogenase [Corynebacterium epidermidicanis]|uniref:3-hydroxyisobutyrate dehydrogenase n=1 Tax=Corynebacterium epidermidicanis TaxID=1050174 RepID=A0A0G3GP13_9CORY|nr:3-hydroxyisobutyrate dehydrogenase [Corynebacterium epidermidicanis]AKK02290.1 3-hydroxyisobutyrate dehydrogenase [Corynebacterium epidermidicanis]